MAQKRTIRRFEKWREDEKAVDEFFRLMEGTDRVRPLRLRDACMTARLPYSLVHRHIKERVELKARYDAVRAANADLYAHEAVAIADGVRPERGHVAKAKLRVDTRLQLASKWDRDDYGDRLQVEKRVEIGVDSGLLGTAADLLRLAAARRIASDDTVTLPSPSEDED